MQRMSSNSPTKLLSDNKTSIEPKLFSNTADNVANVTSYLSAIAVFWPREVLRF